MLVILKDQFIEEGGLFEVRLYGLPIFLKATKRAISACYDTACRPIEFDPNHHGFIGMNESLCRLILLIEPKNALCIKYLMENGVITT